MAKNGHRYTDEMIKEIYIMGMTDASRVEREFAEKRVDVIPSYDELFAGRASDIARLRSAARPRRES